MVPNSRRCRRSPWSRELGAGRGPAGGHFSTPAGCPCCLHGGGALGQRANSHLSPTAAPPPRSELGALQLHQAQLIAAVVPAPRRCIAELHALLPELARRAHAAYLADVRALAESVERPPVSAEEFVTHLQLLRGAEGERQALQRRHNEVNAHFELMQEFWVPLAQEDREAVAGLDCEVRRVECGAA
jgi:hypothetical protein